MNQERSNWAGLNAGIQSSGDNSMNVIVTFDGPLPRPEKVAFPAQHLRLSPRHIGKPFIGREYELAELRKMLSTGSGLITQTITGLGGIGKSTLAHQYALRYSSDYALVYWLAAETPNQIESELAGLAACLDARFAVAPPLFAAKWAKAWLSTHSKWLLVLDNVNDPGDIGPLMADLPNGKFLITSRIGSGWQKLQTIRLKTLEPESAIRMLEGVDHASEICEELGYLPLAIELAGAYIEQSQIPTPDYLDLLRAHRPKALQNAALDTIMTLWNITLCRIERENPLAVGILGLLSWFPSTDTQRVILDPLADRPAIIRALALLNAYSMIDLTSDSISVHRLVQAAVRHDSDIELAGLLLRRAIRNKALGWHQMLAHVNAFAANQPEINDPWIKVLISTSLALKDLGLEHHALGYLQQIADYYKDSDDPNRPWLLSLHARAHLTADDADRAVELFELLCADLHQRLGPDAQPTLRARTDQITALNASDNIDQAIRLGNDVIARLRRILGAHDRQTLIARYNVACSYWAIDKVDQAIPMLESVITDLAKEGCDPADLFLLNTRLVLASAYAKNGELKRSIAIFEEAAAKLENHFGDEHRDTLIAKFQLAHTYGLAGNFKKTIELGEAIATQARCVLGPDSRITLEIHRVLAFAYYRTGYNERGITMLNAVLKRTERLHGRRDSRTRSTREELLAMLNEHLGRLNPKMICHNIFG